VIKNDSLAVLYFHVTLALHPSFDTKGFLRCHLGDKATRDPALLIPALFFFLSLSIISAFSSDMAYLTCCLAAIKGVLPHLITLKTMFDT
jgi:hypothetical protein